MRERASPITGCEHRNGGSLDYSRSAPRGTKTALQLTISQQKQHFAMSSLRNVYTALLLVIARSTDRDLAREIIYQEIRTSIATQLPARWEQSNTTVVEPDETIW